MEGIGEGGMEGGGQRNGKGKKENKEAGRRGKRKRVSKVWVGGGRDVRDGVGQGGTENVVEGQGERRIFGPVHLCHTD